MRQNPHLKGTIFACHSITCFRYLKTGVYNAYRKNAGVTIFMANIRFCFVLQTLNTIRFYYIHIALARLWSFEHTSVIFSFANFFY